MNTKKNGILLTSIVAGLLLSNTAYANSSWHWISQRTPFDILPYVVILTLLVECIAIRSVNNLQHRIRIIISVCLGNLASYLLPYAFLLTPSAVGYTFEMSINHLPLYTIGIGYLFLTLIAEIPIVYLSLRNVVADRRKLLISIVAVNVVTTILVGVAERIVCNGSW